MAGPAQADLMRLAQVLMGGRGATPQRAPAYAQPFVGLHNAPQALPPFEQPGSSLPMGDYMPSAAPAPAAANTQPTAAMMPPVTVAASPLPPDAPQGVPQAAPMPPAQSVRSDVLAALQQMAQQGRLPEQWKGAFANQYGEPT